MTNFPPAPPEIRCPKCNSNQLYAGKKGFSGKKAAAGAIITGGVGLLAGTIGSNKIKITCLNCGYVFHPGDTEVKLTIKEKVEINKSIEAAHTNFFTQYEVGNKDDAFEILKVEDPSCSKFSTPDEAYNSLKNDQKSKTIGCLFLVLIAAFIAYMLMR